MLILPDPAQVNVQAPRNRRRRVVLVMFLDVETIVPWCQTKELLLVFSVPSIMFFALCLPPLAACRTPFVSSSSCVIGWGLSSPERYHDVFA